MIIRMYLIDGLRSAQGDACVEQRSKKGQQANSPGHRPGYGESVMLALKGQKHCFLLRLLPFQGVDYASLYPGRCPGLVAYCPFGALSRDCG